MFLWYFGSEPVFLLISFESIYLIQTARVFSSFHLNIVKPAFNGMVKIQMNKKQAQERKKLRR